jgi:hypothetical protein
LFLFLGILLLPLFLIFLAALVSHGDSPWFLKLNSHLHYRQGLTIGLLAPPICWEARQRG